MSTSPIPILTGRPKAEPTTQQRIRLSAYALAVKAAAAGGVSVTDVISQGTATLAASVLAQYAPTPEPAILSVKEAKAKAGKAAK
jgi:hypothetical protein